MDFNEYPEYMEPHHIFKNAMDIVLKAEKLNGFVISINHDDMVSELNVGSETLCIGLLEQFKYNLLKRQGERE